jgi:2-haloacid dehalogenase
MSPEAERPPGPGGHRISGGPEVLVFDVNETLLDLESLNPLFGRIFGHPRVMREWLGHLVMYSMTLTLSGLYEDYLSLGRGLLKMVGDIHGVEVTDDDLDALESGMRTLPAHADVDPALARLREAGFRMVTLTNSPPARGGLSPLEHAGLADYFERQFSVETTRAYKPSPSTYHMVAQELAVPPASCLMVATHVWDTIGAGSAGLMSGLLTRPGNAPLVVGTLPRPDIVARDMSDLAHRLLDLDRG